MKYIIVGGVAGGATLAQRIQGEIQKMPEIILFEKRGNISRMPIAAYLII